MSTDLNIKDDRIAELERLLTSMQQGSQSGKSVMDMEVDNLEIEKEDESLLSYDCSEFELPANNGNSNSTTQEAKAVSYTGNEDSENKEQHEHNPSSYNSPSNKTPNIKYSRKPIVDSDGVEATPRSTRAKTSLQMAIQDKSSSSEGATTL